MLFRSEAKKTSVSPRIGKVQAKMYAEALEIETGARPIIFYTNGIDYYIWDDTDYPERKITGIYSKKDLESLMFRKKNRESLENPDIRDDITNRPYQKEAITRVLESFGQGNRKALLVMATGERVIIVMGAVCVIKSRVSGTLDKYISCIA